MWEGILTNAARKRWTESLQKLQQMNDAILMDTEWSAIDFQGRGFPPPLPEQITPAFLAACCGGSEQMPGFLRTAELRRYMHTYGLFGPGAALVTRGFESQGVMPEYFPAGYDDFIMDVTTAHPQMMALFRKLFGDRFILDHCFMLNRAIGSKGRRWHAHQYRDGQYEVEDPIGTGNALTTEFLKRQCIRTLCYPEGATIEDGGELAIIPGAHLYRIPYKWSTERPDDDAAMKAGWLKGKIHAFTGKPLEIVHLSLPPGSMVSFVHHMPHYVGYRKPGTTTRWGLLMAYRTPDRMQNPKSGRMVFPRIGWNRRQPKESCLLRRSVCLRLITPSTSIYRTESFADICRRTISATGRWNRIILRVLQDNCASFVTATPCMKSYISSIKF